MQFNTFLNHAINFIVSITHKVSSKFLIGLNYHGIETFRSFLTNFLDCNPRNANVKQIICG